MAMIFAARATPNRSGFEAVNAPAAIPATCVPWKHCGTGPTGQFLPVPGPTLCVTPPGQKELAPPPLVEKHASETTFPARNGCVLSTPVSSTATAQPPPEIPAFQRVGAWMRGTLTVTPAVPGRSSCTLSTFGSLRIRRSWVASTHIDTNGIYSNVTTFSAATPTRWASDRCSATMRATCCSGWTGVSSFSKDVEVRSPTMTRT